MGECDGEAGLPEGNGARLELGIVRGDRDLVEGTADRDPARSPGSFFQIHADLWVLKAWREPFEPIGMICLQISQTRPWVVFPFARVVCTVSYAGVVGSASNIRYSGLGDGVRVGDLPQRADMAGGGLEAANTPWPIYNIECT